MARVSLLMLLLVLSFSSCQFYKRDIMFRTEGMPDSMLVKAKATLARVNYQIQPFDWLEVKVHSNGGEQLVDPNAEFGKQLGASTMQSTAANNINLQLIGTTNPGRYLVNSDGVAVLPLVGTIKLAGLTYRQADSLLSQRYSNFYEDAYVLCRASSRRCLVFTTTGGLNLQSSFANSQSARVVALNDEGLSIFEVLALAGGVPAYTDMSKVRVVRNAADIKKAKIEVLNLQSLATAQAADTRIFPNDIVYIEPVRRPALDVVRDLAPIISLPLSLLTAILLITYRR